MELTIEQRNLVRRLLERRYSLDELRTLAFDIGLDYESIPHDTISQIAREITLLCVRQERVYDLLRLVPIEYLDKPLIQLLRGLNTPQQTAEPARKKGSKKKVKPEPIRIVLADSHTTIRQALQLFLSLDNTLSIIGIARNAAELVAIVEALKPDIALFDLNEMRPFETNAGPILQRLSIASPTTRAVIFTTIIGIEAISTVLQFGIAGYLTKDIDAYAVVNALHLIHKGLFCLSPRASEDLTEFISLPPRKLPYYKYEEPSDES